jgi:hypothetical protein
MMRLRKDLRSKILDGIVSASILLLIFLVIFMIILAVQQYFGRPGLLILAICLLALGMFFFEHSMFSQNSETRKVWYGMVAGLLAWRVAALSTLLGGSPLAGGGAVLLFIMVGLIIASLWRRVLPVGARLFSLTVMLNWAGNQLLVSRSDIFAINGPLGHFFPYFGIVAIVASVTTLGFILFFSKDRVQRISAGLCLSFFIALAIDIFTRAGVF